MCLFVAQFANGMIG